MNDFIGILPLNFMGGVDSDYEAFESSTGTLMSRHQPSGAVRLSVRRMSGPRAEGLANRLQGAPPMLNLILSGVAAIASVFGASEAHRGRRETQAVRAELREVHRDLSEEFHRLGQAMQRSENLLHQLAELVQIEGAMVRDEVAKSRHLGLQRKWENLAHDWEAFLEASTARPHLAEALRETARDFINGLRGEAVNGRHITPASAAPYLFMGYIALAMAYDALGEHEYGQKQLVRLAEQMQSLGQPLVNELTLLGAAEHQNAVELLWGLRRSALAMVDAARPGMSLSTQIEGIAAKAPEVMPALRTTHDFLLPEGSGGLVLDAPLPAATVPQLEVVNNLGGRFGEGHASVPSARQAIASLGHPSPQELEGEIAEDVLHAAILDPEKGIGPLRRDFEVTAPMTLSHEGPTTRVDLDWAKIAERETCKALWEHDQGRSDAASARLRTLLKFIEQVPKKLDSNNYPEIALFPRATRIEIMLDQLSSTGGGANPTLASESLSQVEQLRQEADEQDADNYQHLASLYMLRASAWSGDSSSLPGQLDQLNFGDCADVCCSSDVMRVLLDVARATDDAASVLRIAKESLPPRPRQGWERVWLNARLHLAELVALNGDRKDARRIAAKVRDAAARDQAKYYRDDRLHSRAVALYERLGASGTPGAEPLSERGGPLLMPSGPPV